MYIHENIYFREYVPAFVDKPVYAHICMYIYVCRYMYVVKWTAGISLTFFTLSTKKISTPTYR